MIEERALRPVVVVNEALDVVRRAKGRGLGLVTIGDGADDLFETERKMF